MSGEVVALTRAPGSIADVLARHPWPTAWAGARRLEWLWTVDLDVSPQAIWPHLADLSRLNRAFKLPPMRYVERDGERWGEARYTGVRHVWREPPWNWQLERAYQLVREYTHGAMRALTGIVELQPQAGGTRVQIYYGVVPRSRIFDLGLRWSFGRMGRAYQETLPQIAREIVQRKAPMVACLTETPPALEPQAAQRLTELSAQLVQAGVASALIERLNEWVRGGDDLDLARVRPLERARAWGAEPREVLTLCLHATRAGLLEMAWETICPHCRGARESTTVLAELPTRGSCTACAIDFGTDGPDAVEIAFRVHPSIRAIDRPVFCSAEPAHKPHIQVQHTVAAGQSVVVRAPAQPGRYRARLRGATRSIWIDVDDDGAEAVSWQPEALTPTRMRPGAAIALTVPAGAVPQTFVIEVATWLELALRPRDLLSFAEFRDLFAREQLGADVQLAVGEQTLLFTDVVGSTALYARAGDPTAFARIKGHFDELFALVARHHGAVVKTIGDAVMAAFIEPRDAVRCAHAIHAAFPVGRKDDLRLRISLNTGPCIAVRLNANIDYFGNAVNLAAKLQACAEGGQVALGASTWAAAGVHALVADLGGTVIEHAVRVKGVGTQIPCWQWTC